MAIFHLDAQVIYNYNQGSIVHHIAGGENWALRKHLFSVLVICYDFICDYKYTWLLLDYEQRRVTSKSWSVHEKGERLRIDSLH